MIRLHFVVEGQTEETFVNQTLRPHLWDFNLLCDARCVLTSRQGYKQFKGGVSRYPQIDRDLRLWMREDQDGDARFTTMFDLYRLPKDFPGRRYAGEMMDPYKRIRFLEEQFEKELGDPRFTAHLQLHEFEALLFSDIARLSIEFPSAKRKLSDLEDSVRHFASPELIDDGIETAPSKRIIPEVPDYDGLKAAAGPRVAQEIGLPRIRAACPHFDGWVSRLEGLAST